MSQNPYAPVATPISKSGSQYQKQYHFRSLGFLSILVVVSVGLTCLLRFLISAAETVGFLSFPDYLNPTAEVSSNQELLLIYFVTGVATFSIITYRVGAISACVFSYRSNANLRSLNVTGLEYTPGWCAGWWFVPIAHLFKPYQTVSETYTKSEQLHGVQKGNSLGVWWGLWILGTILTRVENRLALNQVDIGPSALVLSWVTTLIFCGAGVLFIVIVRTITANQHEYVEKAGRGF